MTRGLSKNHPGEFTGRRLFAADGGGSAVRTGLFGRRLISYVPALEAIVAVPDAALQGFGDHAVFDFGGMPKGYGWIFPKRDHLMSASTRHSVVLHCVDT